MIYSIIGNGGAGFTNQIIALITSVITANSLNEKVVVVDNFLNDIKKTTYTPISQIFNLPKINLFLKNNYDIIIIDKYDFQFELISCNYGTNETNFFDLTHFIKQNYFKDKRLFIDKSVTFNNIKGDPCPGLIKKFILKYKINNYIIEEIYDENLKSNIEINPEAHFEFRFSGTSLLNTPKFINILKNIYYHDNFVLESEFIIKKWFNPIKKINIIHLRLEDDAIEHWSRENNMTFIEFKEYLENKYIKLIKTYLSPSDENIILSSSLSNGVLDFLNIHNYNYKFNNKIFEDREKNAIIDLLVSKFCTNIFIGNFNIKGCNGSTFSYYIGKIISEYITQININLDHILEEEVVLRGLE
jgi:hypothetical protein